MHYKFENFLNYERGVKSKANGFIKLFEFSN